MKFPFQLALLGLVHLALSADNDKTLLWGPYRPNLYFGLRPRIPNSLMTGLMWFGTHDYQSISRETIVFFVVLLGHVTSVVYRDATCL